MSPHSDSDERRRRRGRARVNGFGALCFIILILAGGMGAGSHNPESAERTGTRVTGKIIAYAIHQFYGDHGHLPLPSGPIPNGQDMDTDSTASAGVIRILLGREPEVPGKQNIRNLNYLEGISGAHPGTGSQASQWLNGLVMTGDHFSAVDAWGNPFHLRLDTSGDGRLANPGTDGAGDDRPTVEIRAMVWSSGKDGREDNIRSWD